MPAAAATSAPTDLEAFVTAFDDFVRAAKRARARVEPDSVLTPSQLDLLGPLADGDVLGLRELARAAGVSAPTATRMLDGLQTRGLVSRERCSDDRRAVRVAVTEEGAAAVAASRERLQARRRALFEHLEPEERRAAARVLARLAAAYEEL